MVGRIDIEKMKGKIKRAAGWLTGDRWVEAEGAVEAERGHPPDPDELAEVEDEVRKDHGDISRDAGGPKDDPPALSLIGEGEGGGLPGSDDAS